MKRSRHIALVAMGTAALALSACGEGEAPIAVYADAADCAKDGKFGAAECQAAEDEARRAHIAAPAKHADVADCERLHGAGGCEPVTVPWQAKFPGWQWRGRTLTRFAECQTVAEGTWIAFCESFFTNHHRRHFDGTPKYHAREACERAHPAGCEQPEVLAAAGTPAPRAETRPGWHCYYFYRNYGGYTAAPTPLYRSVASGQLLTGDGRSLAAGARGVRNVPASFVGGSASRGGFGSSSRSYGSSGG